MANGNLDSLYQAVSNQFDIGTFEDFSAKMQTPDDRKSFFDAVSMQFDIGDYNEFESKLADPKDVAKKIPKLDWEVDYEYDRSKGIRPKKGSYGKYIDDAMYKIMTPFIEKTNESIASAQSGEYTDEMLELIEKGGGRTMSPEEAGRTIDLFKAEAKKAPTKNMLNWINDMEEASNPVYGFFKATAKNPVAAYEVIVSSIAGQAKALESGELAAVATTVGVGTAAIGSTFGPVGTVAAFLRGFMSTMGGGVETASKFGELIKEEFEGEIPAEEELISFIQDEEKFNNFRNKALAKGITIAAVDNFGGGMVVKSVAKTAKTGRRVRAATKGLIGESIVGGGGEALSSVVIGDEVSAVDVGLEILGQAGQASVDIGGAIVTPGSYKVNGKKASLREVNKILETAKPEELAKINIEVTNDQALDAEIRSKQNDAILETQVDAKVEDEGDRKQMVDLEKRRVKAEADAKKKGIQAVPGAVETLESIEMQMNEIVGKYTAIDARTKDVRARKKVAEEVRADAVEKVFQSNLEFAKKHSALYGLEVDDTLTVDQIEKEYGKEAAMSDGFIKGDKIIINKAVAKNTGAVNVGNHELLHGILRKAVKEGKINKNLISDFKEKVGQDNWSKIEQRIKDAGYTTKYMNDTPEEYLTLFSDAIANNEIKFDENVFTKIGDLITPVLRAFGFKQIDFETADGVYDFLKEYNRSIHKGALSSAIVKETAGKVDVEGKKFAKSNIQGILEEYGGKVATKPDLRRMVNETLMKTPQGKETFDITKSRFGQEVEPIVEAITQRLYDKIPSDATRAAGLTRVDYKNALVSEAATMTQQEYNPAIQDLDTFISNRLNLRAESLAKRLGVEEKILKDIDFVKETDIEVVEEVVEKKPKPTKKEKPRVLKSLADVNLDNKEIISTTVRAEINVLIEQNPKNLEEQITNLIEKEITKAVKAQMGKISSVKGEVVISDEYKAFIALNYENIVQGFDVNTIKNNYKTLFELTEIGKEDRKTRKADKPSLKKDSNYRKGIFKIETNKAKFTKFFTEGGYTTLLARQKGLANQIAKGITEDVVNNEIINNSENNETIVKAELQNVINSLNKQKKEVQGNYNDQIKFSKNVRDQISYLSTKVQESQYTNEVFNEETGVPVSKLDPDGHPWIPEAYESIFSLVQDGRIIPKGTKNNVFKKMMEKLKLPTDKTIGDTFERWYYDGAKAVGLLADGFVLTEDHILVQSIGSFVRKVVQAPDLLLEFVNSVGRKVQVGFEIKATGNTKMGHNKVWSKLNDYLFKKNAGLKGDPKNPKFVNDKLEEVFNNVAAKAEKLSKYLKKEFNVTWESRQDFIPFLSEDNRIVYNDQVVKDLKAAARDGSVTINEDFVAHHYNSKGVFYIQIADKGLFYLGSDPLNLAESLGVTKFEGEFVLQGRLLVSPKSKGGKKIGRIASIDVEPIMDPRRITSKVGFSLDQPGGWKALRKALKNAPVVSGEVKDINTFNNAVKASRSTQKESKGITVLDFDDTLATTKSLVKFTRPDGITGTLNAEEYAAQYQDLLAQGYKFDFTEFDKVVKAKLAPLFNKALKLQKKFGPENMFILTARPPAAQKAIYDFLKANGLNIPIKNISALGNSTAEAKALWVADKVGEGYNDFYFADDALQNTQAVQNMLDQFDVKSKVQQAKVKFSKSMNTEFNNILEDVVGIDSKKRFSAIKARKRGESKGKFRFFIPPSHEDFVGLLYNFIGKGKKGNQHRNFFEQALVRPLNRAYRELNTAKQSIANDYKSLNKEFKNVKKKLTKKTPDGDFTYQDAIRVYLFDKHGHKVPGLTKTDQQKLVDLVMEDTELQTYAETLNIISKQETYVKPPETWETGDIRVDLDDATGRVGRASYFTEFNENADVIFSEDNLNKIEAAYGEGMVSAIKDILYRTKTGRNRPSGQNKLVNGFLNYLNGSVASTMFFNIRSAVLQQMSMVNFINFADNNIFAAAKAFANQKQYYTDWAFIFNSDFMKQRRRGIQTDVNGAELVASLRGAKNTPRALLAKLLQLGFLPTQIGDNVAIATGGATFYRNRINTYLKQGLTQKEVESKAWIDFQVLAEATQQSARPDMVSQQQASPLGKIILAFQNVTSQFNRIGKKGFLDIYHRRITPGNTTQFQSDISNLSRISYYFVIQNLIFYSLQSALFMAMFDDDEDDERWLNKKERVINGSIDSVLRGTGVWGAVVATLKNMAIKWHEQREKGYNADESAVLMEMLNVSPPLGIKARKLVNAERTLNYNKKVIDEMETFDIDNPQWSAYTNYIESTTNIPLNRLYNKTQNVRQSLNSQHEALQRVLMFGGWSQWNLGIENEKIEKIKEKTKKKSTGRRTRTRKIRTRR